MRQKWGLGLLLGMTIALVSKGASPAIAAPIPLQAGLNAPLFVAPPVPADLGQPMRRSDAGSRGCGSTAATDLAAPPVTALVPVYNASASAVFSRTASLQPVLWVYLPFNVPVTGTLAFEDAATHSVYQGTFTTSGTPGVIRLQPDTGLPWSERDRYRWFIILNCQSEADYVLEGWVERAAIAADAAPSLADLPLATQVEFYGQQGLWHEALTLAADASPIYWSELLTAIGLGDLIAEPRLDCCTVQAGP